MRSGIILLLFSLSALSAPGSYAKDHKIAPAGNNRKDVINGPNADVLPVASFRIVFGLKDTELKAWDGQAIPGAGQQLVVEADRFRDHQYEAKGWKNGIVSIKLGDSKFPNDYLKNATTWYCSTRYSSLHGPTTEWHDYGQIDSVSGGKSLKPIIVRPSILVNLKSGSLNEPIHIKTVRGDFSFKPGDVMANRISYFLDNNISVAVVPPVEHVSPQSLGQQDFPSILWSKSKKLWSAWQEHTKEGDQLIVQSKTGNTWGPRAVLAQKADIFNTALAEDAQKRIWVTWSMQVNGKWDIYGRFYDGVKWSKQDQITHSEATKNVYHQMVADSKGNVWLVWQRTADSYSQIYAKYFNGRQWSVDEQLSTGKSKAGNNWWPVIAAGPNGSLAVAWDGYASGSYDVYLKRRTGNAWGKEEVVAGTALFEAHPTVAIDNSNKIWVAWDESGINWGKDVAFLLDHQATRLHESRSISIICLDGDKRLSPMQDIKQVFKPGEFWELPHLQIDAQGKPWLLARHLVMREPDTPLEGPIDLALFEDWATMYDGEKWIQPMYLPRSTGRNDMMPATALASDGNIWAAWPTDLRDAKTYQPEQLEVQVAKIDKVNSVQQQVLQSYQHEEVAPYKPFDAEENAQVQRIRNYKIHNDGKTYSIFRGDLHRHTDVSCDGNTDGSLLDAYRYARDVAALDFLGVSNHTDDSWDTYNWWYSQKTADLFQIKNSFVAFYGYERSVEYPNGHRNIFFTKRNSADVFPIGAFEARGGYVGSGALYWYLRRNGGFSIPHTTGRTSGTDWRDNDPKVESVMEIYQGMRDSYEYPGSPRPFKLYTLPDSTKPIGRASSAPASASFRTLGFAWNALAKGYKFGFIASSDHISTHVSYACLIAENLTPQGLLEAIQNRRTYAATDNIILDVKYKGSDGEHLMGDIFNSTKPVQLNAQIIGTGDILQVDIIEDNAIVKTYKPESGSTFNVNYTDKKVKNNNTNYIYIRVMQKDGEMAWGSPVWVTYK